VSPYIDRPLPRPTAWLAPLAMKAAELERVTAERDAARDLAAHLERRLAGIEFLHDAQHYCRGYEDGELRSWFYKGDAADRCLTYRLAHGTEA